MVGYRGGGTTLNLKALVFRDMRSRRADAITSTLTQHSLGGGFLHLWWLYYNQSRQFQAVLACFYTSEASIRQPKTLYLLKTSLLRIALRIHVKSTSDGLVSRFSPCFL